MHDASEVDGVNFKVDNSVLITWQHSKLTTKERKLKIIQLQTSAKERENTVDPTNMIAGFK